MANPKALTIDVRKDSVPSGKINDWSSLGNASIFIKNIVTPTLSKSTNIGQLVSGIPTAFARVDLFKTALDHVSSEGANTDENNLVSYYTRLADEWRGLIACLALDYAHISVRRIDLAYSDGKPTSSTANVYEPKGAFGNMLLRRADRWKDQNVPANQTAVPYLNLIKYRGQVVGATAPESLLFTSTGYHAEPNDERPWIDVVTGKFIDPLKSSMTPIQLATLHAYVSHILNGLQDAEEYYSGLPMSERVNYSTIRDLLSKWKNEIAARANREGVELSIGSTPPVNANFGGPFQKLFTHQDILHGLEGVISETDTTGAVEFDPKNLLLEDTARIARLDLRIDPSELSQLPILVMTADVKGSDEKAYFALPLSAQGLNVFGKNVGALVGMSAATSAIPSSLKATYDPAARTDNLEVVLTLTTNAGIRRTFKKVYTCDGSIRNKDILIWPNFISPQWNAYYLYNELPHNGTTQSYRAFPFVGKMEENYFRILVDKNHSPILLSDSGRITAPKDMVKAELLVFSDDKVANIPYKYEIYKSNRPYKGVRLLSPTGNEGGYLLINYSTSQDEALPHDWMTPGTGPTLTEVRLGIDFGSTNTSIAYSSDVLGENGFEFGNQRVSLMGNERPGIIPPPRENQVLFFQGAGSKVKSNAIKSVLTLHDNLRLPPLKKGDSAKLRNEKEVIGGFPSFADNLPFSNSDNKKITLFYPEIREVTQIHNMKWEDNDEDKAHKSAFLRTLMLQVYATLFAQGKVPTSLKWSYPSAMAGQLLYSYQNIWSTLNQVSPVMKEDGSPYQLNISRYTDTRSIGDAMGGEGGFGSGSFGGSSQGFGGTASAGFGAGNNNAGNAFGGGFGGGFGAAGGFGDASGFGNASGGFGNAGGGFGAAGGFGTSDPASAAQSSEKAVRKPGFMPDDPEEKVEYKPEPLYTMNMANANPSLSEAEAVANFISNNHGKEAHTLNLCFDVGGSTTDISALFYLKGGITMIKQNSIRFAAQRVSQAVAKFPTFKKVLYDICSRFNIKMLGLNYGPDSYNEHTAPYFFDQIVNRLDNSQLSAFYQTIAADCPQLMCVNMYVTGLLMFYAGQIAHKLVDDLLRTPDEEWPGRTRPRVRVSFAGKGSRLFQWLNVLNPQAAYHYYGQMFVMGYGAEHLQQTLADWQEIKLPDLNDADNKFEVSKGLAKGDTILQRPKKANKSEIIGEAGFEVMGDDNQRRPVEFTNSLTPEMLSEIGIRFTAPNSGPQAQQFTNFCGFFYQAANQLFGWSTNPRALEKACNEMNITGYVQNMPEFRAAQREAQQSGKSFDFVAPIIILEGMKFYDTVLLKMLSAN